MLYFILAFILYTATIAHLAAYVAHERSIDAARRLDAARRRSAAVTFEQARAACVLADAGVLPERTMRRPSRRRPLVRAAAMAAGAAAAAVLLAAPLVSSLAGADVHRAAHSIVRQ